jgi:23S rRNA (guanine2445-N2)-methyltransferase
MPSFLYQQSKRYVVQVPEGLEPLAARELEALGAGRLIPGFRAIAFSADPATVYRIHYQARLIMRLLAPLAEFRCRNRDDLYRAGKSVDWPALFSPDRTFAVHANVSGNENLRHSKFAALCLKDAIADRFRDDSGKRPDVDARDPDLWLNLYIDKEQATIALDTSVAAFNRRGYRIRSIDAPMQEVLAAAMVAHSGWDGESPLYDPMCGSGTLLCEAMMAYGRVPAGYLRKANGLRLLPDFHEGLWRGIKKEADEKIRRIPVGLVSGSDIDPAAVKAANLNCRNLPGGERINIYRKDFNELPDLRQTVILCNPPYGIRSMPEQDLADFYRRFGDFLKQRCSGATAYIYFGNREMLKHIGLKPAWKRPMKNAGIDGRLAKFELY